MRKANNIKPRAFAGRTNAHINDPGITYNEAGVTYNDARYTYGGVYGDQDIKPIFAKSFNLPASLLLGRTNAQVNDPGITYNEVGVTYDDVRYAYGGVYGDQNILAIINKATIIKSRTLIFTDRPDALNGLLLTEDQNYLLCENGNFLAF